MASREALEQQRAHHYECIRVINTQINALAPVSRIPPELLSKIFLHTADHRANPASRLPQVCYAWIRVTHVCSHWRETALQCTALWSHVDVPALPERLAEFLVRSKEAPLSMTLSFRRLRQPGTKQSVSSEDAVQLALSALHRVRTLAVDVSRDPTEVVLEILGGRAPLIESLTITRDLTFAGASRSLPKFRASFSRMLSNPESRRLRTLATHLHCLTWSEIFCDSLTRLEVYGHGDTGESIPSFFKALSRMSRLEELILRGIFVRARDGSTEVIMDPITLPHLQRLRTHGESTRSAAILLNNLHTPSLSHLYVDVVQGKFKEEHVRLFAAMTQKATTLGQLMTVAFSLHTATSICAYRDVCQHTTNPNEDSTSGWLMQRTPTLEYRGQSKVDNIPLAEFCRLLPVHDAQALLLGYDFIAQDQWLDIARCMEAVTELRLHSVTANNVISPGKLLSLRQKDTGDGHTPFVLPKLRALTMDTVNFREDFPARRHKYHERETGVVAALRACFVRRAQEGAEIDTLRILRARKLWKEDLERLREVMSRVESDDILEDYHRHTDLCRARGFTC